MYKISYDGTNKKVLWQELWRHEFLDALERDAVVIVPVGSVEQHGPHCPIDVDISAPFYMAVALRARENGASVAILEKADQIGGSAAASGGTIWCASNIGEWLKVQPDGDTALGTALIDYFYVGIDWLIKQGVSLQARAEPNPYKFQRTIYQLLPDARTAMETLSDQFQARGGRIFTNTDLTGLLGGRGEPIAGEGAAQHARLSG